MLYFVAWYSVLLKLLFLYVLRYKRITYFMSHNIYKTIKTKYHK